MAALHGESGAGQTRSILLGAHELSYTLRRSRRRTLGMTIDGRGLVVTIPLRSSIAEAEAFIREKGAWVLANLDEWSRRPQPVQPEPHDGFVFPLRGQRCTLRLQHGLKQPRWQEDFYGHELHLPPATGRALRTQILRAVQRYALGYFGGRVDEYAYTLQQIVPHVEVPPLRLTNARTRWGSCSRISGIRLNWRLIHLPAAQIDYVVAHELAHLVEMNHSPRFWAMVGEMYPDYDEARKALNESARIIPEW